MVLLMCVSICTSSAVNSTAAIHMRGYSAVWRASISLRSAYLFVSCKHVHTYCIEIEDMFLSVFRSCKNQFR